MVEIIFFQTEGGHLPVRENLESLPGPDQAKAAAHLALLQKQGHALRLPHVRHMSGTRLHELRFKISAGQYRVFFFFQVGNKVVLVHSMVKKAQQTPKADLDLAVKRMREWIRKEGE